MELGRWRRRDPGITLIRRARHRTQNKWLKESREGEGTANRQCYGVGGEGCKVEQ